MNPTEHHPKTPRRTTGLVALLGALLCIAGSAASAALPATASASATIEGPPTFSAAPGLPDGRIYEQVSPGDKYGNQAGASTSSSEVGVINRYGLASVDGSAVLFEGTGPMGESPSGDNKWFVATKKTGEPGWSTRALTPAIRARAVTGNGLSQLDPSPDLSHAMVEGELLHREGCGELYFTGPDPFVAATELGRTELADPVEHCGQDETIPAGGTADFSTVYFTYAGTLLPEDVERAPHAHGNSNGEGSEAWGFYESREGALREAGVLPDNEVSEFGAVPAASGHGRNLHSNQVSTEPSPEGAPAGSRAFFVSPDPASCTYNGGHNNCATDPPELYVRENGERTLLVSRDTLLPEAEGLPAPASDGVLRMPNPIEQRNLDPAVDGSYVFASPDGSQAFFQSASALTAGAEEASPGSEPKTYDFDVDTGVLTYLPGVQGEILASDGDGSSIAFLRPGAGGEPARLELWSAGAAGGTVTPITGLPDFPFVSEARISSDGSVLVFQTASRLSGSFNSGGDEEIYRYDVSANTLGCVSCAPAGVTPGPASMSALRSAEAANDYALGDFGSSERMHLGRTEGSGGAVDERGVSSDGDRIFFETRVPLVPQDSNTNSPPVICDEDGNTCVQGADVYEWENGVIYLISTGKSPLDSYFLDNSENGDDVFFATAEGLVPGDTDAGYDVYDARIPHPGEPFPPAAVPCEGAVCQGPPRVESPLAPPARATVPGTDNLTPEVTRPPAKKVTTKTVKCKKGFVKKKNKCVKAKKKTKARKASNDRGAK
jgi:hypothetical protein